jgi:hypothetical protein
MRFRSSMFLATLYLICFTIAAWSTPVAPQPAAGAPQPMPDNQSLSGTIASVGNAKLSVRGTKDQDVNTVQFLVDDKTKMEGKLTVGAQATVEYYSNEGKNIAIRVVATPASGLNLY